METEDLRTRAEVLSTLHSMLQPTAPSTSTGATAATAAAAAAAAAQMSSASASVAAAVANSDTSVTDPEQRRCFDCGEVKLRLTAEFFSSSQQRKKQGQRRCVQCVAARPVCHNNTPQPAASAVSNTPARQSSKAPLARATAASSNVTNSNPVTSNSHPNTSNDADANATGDTAGTSAGDAAVSESANGVTALGRAELRRAEHSRLIEAVLLYAFPALTVTNRSDRGHNVRTVSASDGGEWCPWLHTALGQGAEVRDAIETVRKRVEFAQNHTDSNDTAAVAAVADVADAPLKSGENSLACQLGLYHTNDAAYPLDELPQQPQPQSHSHALLLPAPAEKLPFPLWTDPVRSGGLRPAKAVRKQQQQESLSSLLSTVTQNVLRSACHTQQAPSQSADAHPAQRSPLQSADSLTTAAQHARPMHVVDCGCATGNAALALALHHVRLNFSLFDAHARSAQMCAARLWAHEHLQGYLNGSKGGHVDCDSVDTAREALSTFTMPSPSNASADTNKNSCGNTANACDTASKSNIAALGCGGRVRVHWGSLPTERIAIATAAIATATDSSSASTVTSSNEHTNNSAAMRAVEPIDVVIATHSCGVATDYALSVAIRARAAVILTPCCSGKMATQQQKVNINNTDASTNSSENKNDCNVAKTAVNTSDNDDSNKSSDFGCNSDCVDAHSHFGSSWLTDGGAAAAVATVGSVGYPRSRALAAALARACDVLKSNDNNTSGQQLAEDRARDDTTAPVDDNAHCEQVTKRPRLPHNTNPYRSKGGTTSAATVSSLYAVLARSAEATAVAASAVPAASSVAPAVSSANANTVNAAVNATLNATTGSSRSSSTGPQPQPQSASSAAAFHALSKTVLELDRVAWARENGFAVVLAKMTPLGASRKNDVIIAIPQERLNLNN